MLRTHWQPCTGLILLSLALYLPGTAAIPPVDRDEAFYAQTSKQMLRSGDFVRPQFQEKPIGIYWLQSAAVRLAATGDSNIWPYRIPSILGALTAVLLTYWIGQYAFDRVIAFLGAALLASCALLTVLAHLAMIDAVLLACVVGAQGCLARLYFAATQGTIGAQRYALGFWVAQGLGILLKGPVLPLMSALTLGGLYTFDWRRTGDSSRSSTTRLVVRGLRWNWGIPLVLGIVLPWGLAIWAATSGAFYREAILGEILAKMVSGQKSHGAPPGYYLVIGMATFWPASLLVTVALRSAIHNRPQPGVRFCLAWLIPTWIFFALMPTKLPHYVAPVYPALALLVARAAVTVSTSSAPGFWPLLFWTGVLPWCVFTAVAATIAVAAPVLAGAGFDWISILPATAAAGFGAVAIGYLWRGRLKRTAVMTVIGAVAVFAPLLQWVLPSLDDLWLSRSAARAIAQQRDTAGRPRLVAAVGYQEPSLVFLVDTDITLTSTRSAASFLKEHENALVLISDDKLADFAAATQRLGVRPAEVWSADGINYTKGRRIRLRLFERR